MVNRAEAANPGDLGSLTKGIESVPLIVSYMTGGADSPIMAVAV